MHQNPSFRRAPVGIDLGTTMSSVAYVDENNVPQTVRNSVGEYLTPSAILFEDSGPVFGKDAVNGATFSPHLFVECFKRNMGDDPNVEIKGVEIPNEVLSALLLEKLRMDAEATLGPIRDAVITVPAYFDEVRRQATCTAAAMAGINVIEIINEPTAAAIRYGVVSAMTQDNDEGKTVIVYDLGGGTFDVTILRITNERLVTLATDGDVFLGGKDFDGRLVEHLADEFKKEHGLDPRMDPNDHIQLWQDAEEIKKGLSERQSVKHVLYHSGVRMRVEVSREQFEDLTADLISRTRTTSSLVLKDAGLNWSDLDAVLLVGGCSRMPMVKVMLEAISGQSVDTSVDPDFAIGQGAAIYASMFFDHAGSPNQHSPSIVNVNSHSLGILGVDQKRKQRVNSIVIPRNTPLPTRVLKKFKTARQDQKAVKVVVVEGESGKPDNCVELGSCKVTDLPDGLPAGTPVYVELGYDIGGRLTVSAKVASTRQSANMSIDRSSQVDLGSLVEWKAKVGGAAESGSEVVVDLAVLDRMLAEIGSRHLAEHPDSSVKVKAAQERLVEITKESRQLEKEQSSSRQHPDAIQVASQLADLHVESKRMQNRLDMALIGVGREIVANGGHDDKDIQKARLMIDTLSRIG